MILLHPALHGVAQSKQCLVPQGLDLWLRFLERFESSKIFPTCIHINLPCILRSEIAANPNWYHYHAKALRVDLD